MEDLMQDLKSKELITHEFAATVNASTRTVINRFIMSISERKVSRLCPPEIREFALTLNFHSPKAYSYVRSKLNNILPHPQTISKWYEKIDGEPGISAESMWLLEKKVQHSHGPVVVALMMDEMSIRTKIEYNGKKVEGYVNLGFPTDQSNTEVAKEALVFLVSISHTFL